MAVTATDKFAELESRIARTIDLVKTTRKERDAAERELGFARKQVAQLEEEVEELRQERDVIKSRVESLLDNLIELTEGPIA